MQMHPLSILSRMPTLIILMKKRTVRQYHSKPKHNKRYEEIGHKVNQSNTNATWEYFSNTHDREHECAKNIH